MPEPIATYKDLCLDVTGDGRATAEFWAAALGRGPVDDRGSTLLVTAPSPREVLWVNPVAEPKTVKNRLHIDIHCASVEELEALGARVLERFERWTTMADPGGGEFCAFVREQVPEKRMYELVLDCEQPLELARWWATAIGGEVEADDHGIGIAAIPGAPFEYFVFDTVPEPKRGKNRVHVDVDVDDVSSLVDHGATVLRPKGGDIEWTVLADPEGNEFCAFVRAD
jgi:hypothetical protein